MKSIADTLRDLKNTVFGSGGKGNPPPARFAIPEIASPRHLHVAVTFDCRAACPHCYMLQQNRKAFLSKPHMTEELYRKILSSPHARSAKKITLTGGEPMLHPDFFRWVDLAAGAGIPHVASITNGLSLEDDKTVDRLLSQNTIKYFNVSMDSDTKEGFCRAKAIKNADYDAICRNVKRLTERYKGTATRISGSFVVYTLDDERVRQLIRFSESLGFHKVTLHALHVTKKAGSGEREAAGQADCDAIRKHEDYSVDVTVKLPYPLCRGTFYCPSLATFLCVGATGTLAPCCHVPWDEKYGLYSETEINPMNHDTIVGMRRAFINAADRNDEKLLPEVCRGCSKRSRGHLYYDTKLRRWQSGSDVGG